RVRLSWAASRSHVFSVTPRSRSLYFSCRSRWSAAYEFEISRKREIGEARLAKCVSDYASLMVEILKDNARPEAGAGYGAMDKPWAKLVGQIAHAYAK